MTPAAKTCLAQAVIAAQMLPARITGSIVRAAKQNCTDQARIDYLREAAAKANELLEKIQLARLALLKDRRREGEG